MLIVVLLHSVPFQLTSASGSQVLVHFFMKTSLLPHFTTSVTISKDMLNANNIQLSIRFGYTYELLRPLVQELLQSVVASDRSRAADMPTKWGDTFYPDYNFVYNLAQRHQLVSRRTMELSASKAKITPEDIIEWRRLIMLVIRSVPGLLEALLDPNRSFNYV